MGISFDDTLPAFLKVLNQTGIDISPAAGVFIRDSRGRLSFVAARKLPSEIANTVNAAIGEDLQPYISPLGPIADLDSPGARRVLEDQEALFISVDEHETNPATIIKLLDRRAVGADWLHAPSELASAPPRLVFASLKAGVGRSTALSVLAAELAERGRAILVIDLDMEAPGLGSMLIASDATPPFGSIDFFVEAGLKQLDDTFMLDCIGASWVAGGRGRIDVVPSFGSKSLSHPSGVLAKLARAYLESPAADEHPRTFLTQLQELVTRLTALSRYDAVLVDARAGLHETTAAAILGLGADVLLFGVDQRQTEIGFDILLSHLAQFPVTDIEADWRYRLRVIQAKAVPDESALAAYRTRMFDLFDKIFYQREIPLNGDLLDNGFRFGVDDSDGPHFPIPIFEDGRYRLFDPLRDPSQLLKEFYSKGFGQFTAFCIERLQLNEDDEP